MYTILFTKQALKDTQKLSPKLKQKLQEILIEIISKEPHVGKKLIGELAGNYSYRLDIKNRIIYSINRKKKIIYIKRTKTHYGD